MIHPSGSLSPVSHFFRSDSHGLAGHRRFKAGFISAVITAVSWMVAPFGHAQSLFTSTFETPDIPDLTTAYPGDTLLGEWNVTFGSADLVDTGNIWTSGAAFEGTQYVDLDGSSPGGLARTFPTAPGVSYLVTFAYANNYYNQASAWALVRLHGVRVATEPLVRLRGFPSGKRLSGPLFFPPIFP